MARFPSERKINSSDVWGVRAGRKLLPRRIDPRCQQERKKKKTKTVGRTPFRYLNNYCCGPEINKIFIYWY